MFRALESRVFECSSFEAGPSLVLPQVASLNTRLARTEQFKLET